MPEIGRKQVLARASGRLILAVDDDQDNLTLMSAALEHEGYRVARASNGEQALAFLKSERPDLILLDINMPGIGGLKTLEQVRQREPYVSVIFVSARSETNDIIKGLDAGADDYICKPFDPHELLARVRAQLRVKEVNDRLASANARLQELVEIDDLTGLFNMRSTYQKLDSEIRRAKRFNRVVAVVMMDMDCFKTVNDTNDHLFGSFVLSEVGRLIQDNIRSMDFAARYGGDEFLIALAETTVEGATLFAERVRRVVEKHNFVTKTASMRLTASLGVCAIEPAEFELEPKVLVRCADQALYEAKHAGKNCVRTFDLSTLDLRKTS